MKEEDVLEFFANFKKTRQGGGGEIEESNNQERGNSEDPQTKDEPSLIDCAVCYEEVLESELLTTTCCNVTLCRSCALRMVDVRTCSCTALNCGREWDPRDPECWFFLASTDSKWQVKLIGAWLNKQDNWLACPTGSCYGGAEGKPEEDFSVTCMVCNTPYCSSCENDHGVKVNHKGLTCNEFRSLNPNDEELISEEDSIAWAGAVRCPKCGNPAAREGGCDTLTCPKCNKQFSAYGGDGAHSEVANDFDLALGTFNDRTTERQLFTLIDQHPVMAKDTFKLDRLVERLEKAKEAGSVKGVTKILDSLTAPNFEGLRMCLAALYMPKDESENQFTEQLSTASTVDEVINLLDSREELREDHAILIAISEAIRGGKPPFVIQGLVNKINQNREVKERVTSILKKGRII